MTTSFQPYFIDAMIRWLDDNNLVPYIVLRTDIPGVKVPAGYAQNNRLVLNVSRRAVHNYCMTEDVIAFDARFQSHSFRVQLPVNAIVAVQTKDKAVGFSFEDNNTTAFSFDLDKHELARSRFQVVD